MDPYTGAIYIIIPNSYLLTINDPRINQVDQIRNKGIVSALVKVKIPQVPGAPPLCPQSLLTLDYHKNKLFVVTKDFLIVYNLAKGYEDMQCVPSKRKYFYPCKLFFDDKSTQCNIVATGYDNTQTFTRV